MDRLPVAVRLQAGSEHCPEAAGQGSPVNISQATLPQHWQCWRPSRRHEVEALGQAAFQPVMRIAGQAEQEMLLRLCILKIVSPGMRPAGCNVSKSLGGSTRNALGRSLLLRRELGCVGV